MNSRRQWLLVVLVALFLLPFLIAPGFGSVEMGLWLLMLATWSVGFFVWAKRPTHRHPGAR
jgi:hypothetical protein